ncbi:CPBP family intramembrane metalloprotease [Terrilactibacillus sp. BCM23-1]|uniref:CPBP family intramembrane metalloprotease n=1 Tax=Terrilactibacillus tamarindi TaxID=2599694 RepID=A0A6N8CTD2_9BACI|nr:CPBP family intramembrane glutamic endopeptidase [Terrilactibacillus tamarindi]MTT31246.1 CPBP family intramembrane metalloprotease [Terrilactibacillus tamarindi]
MNRKQLNALSDQEIKHALIQTQLILLLISVMWILIYKNNWPYWKKVLTIRGDDHLFIFGVLPALVVVLLQIIIDKSVPRHWFDDDGMNERMMRALSIPELFLFMGLVAFSEELLFRGLIQSTFGIWITTLCFAVIHVRYLKKPLVIFVLVLISLLLSWLFAKTNSLIIPMVVHFIIDLLLGLLLKWQSNQSSL